MAKIDKAEFETILDRQIQDAAQWQDENLKGERERNYQFYLGQNTSPAPAGRSQAISWDVFETIESALPDLVEIFLGTDQVAAFEPVGEEDEQYAEQATDYINYILLKQNPGFLLFLTWIKDALLSKIGVVRAYWAESEKVTTKEYSGVNELYLTQLLDDQDNEVVEQSSEDDPEDLQRRQMAMQAINTVAPEIRMQIEAYLAQPVQQIYTVTIRTTRKSGRIYIDNVQPENFLISKRAKTLAAADLVGEIKMMTRSDMIEVGYKRSDVENVQSFDFVVDDDQGIAQAADRNLQHGLTDGEAPDDSTEEIEVFDGFIRLNYDGKGVASWRKVVRAGNVTLLNEESEGPDFITMSPILIPHRLVGLALADVVAPLQTVNTAMTRQFIDSMMLANNPRTYVNTDAGVNLDDLLNTTIGGVVRGKAPMQTAISPLVTHNVASSALQGIEFMDTRREARTGITRYNQGLDADSLNKTATGVTKIMAAGDRRKLMMARIMAETGIKDLFRLLLKLVTNNQDKPATIKLRNEWTQIDPTPWSPEMDVTIETGLGTGDKTQLLAVLNGIFTAQKEAMAAKSSLVDEKNIYNTLGAILKASGIKGMDKYFNDPSKPRQDQQQGQQPPEQSPEAALAAAQVKAAELTLQGKQMQIQADMQAKASDLEIEKVKLQQQQVQLQIKQEELALKGAEATERARIADREQNRKDLETADRMMTPTQPAGFPV